MVRVFPQRSTRSSLSKRATCFGIIFSSPGPMWIRSSSRSEAIFLNNANARTTKANTDHITTYGTKLITTSDFPDVQFASHKETQALASQLLLHRRNRKEFDVNR